MDYKESIRIVISHVEQNIKSRLKYNVLERAVGFSYRHLREIFQRVTGMTLSRYIIYINTGFPVGLYLHFCKKFLK